MRLEIDTTVSAPHLAEDSAEKFDSTDARSALNQGIKAAQAGNRAEARAALSRATQLDPRSESGWLWLASISEYPEELLGFLNRVLEINPSNERALEWKDATHALLSKTFVQRGIDAAEANQTEFAAECFHTAIEHNEKNADAWIWVASLSPSNTVKVSMLEKALAVDPKNPVATEALEAARSSILKQRLAAAKGAAVAGNYPEAIGILDDLLVVAPNSIEAWMMKSHLSENFDEKIRCFETILAIEPSNIAAKAGRDSLLTIFGTAEAAQSEGLKERVEVPEAEMKLDYTPTEVAESLRDEISEPRVEVAESQYGAEEAMSEVEDAHVVEDTPIQHPGVSDQAIPSYEFHNGTLTEYKHENEELQSVAEPFASYAEEAENPAEAAVESPHRVTVESVAADHSYEGSSQEYDWESNSDPAIAMPTEEFHSVEPVADAAPITLVEAEEVVSVSPTTVDCPYCWSLNDPQAISCNSCLAVLTLSDLELLLSNHDADKGVVRQAVEDLERQRLSRDFSSDEFITLGLGHLNLKNYQLGFSCLQEASRLNPNNVVLAGQVNSLLIRIEEIKQQEEAHLKLPRGRSILVVDDSPTVRKLISSKLEKSGHEVVCAGDGVEAIEMLANYVPDLVLLDIAMPRMDGYQVCKQIRSNPATKDVTVVMISGKDGFFDKVRGRMAGTTGYITKPFGPETLMKTVEMYLSGEVPELDEV